MPLLELEVPATLARYGCIVPGVLAERREAHRDPRSPPKVSGFGHVSFLVDGSGNLTRGAGPTYTIDVDAQAIENGPWEPVAGGLPVPGHGRRRYRSRSTNPGPTSNYMRQYRFRRTDNANPSRPRNSAASWTCRPRSGRRSSTKSAWRATPSPCGSTRTTERACTARGATTIPTRPAGRVASAST